jgi:hypothetical protein
MPKVRTITPRTPTSAPARLAADRLLGDVRALIEAAREQTARAVNSALVGLCWHIGTRIRQDVLQEQRAEYGAVVVATVDDGVRPGLRHKEPSPHDPLRRGLPRRNDCLRTAERIELDALQGNPLSR